MKIVPRKIQLSFLGTFLYVDNRFPSTMRVGADRSEARLNQLIRNLFMNVHYTRFHKKNTPILSGFFFQQFPGCGYR